MGFKKDSMEIAMHAKRGQLFYHVLCSAIDANVSLATIAKQFPAYAVEPGQVAPEITVKAMTTELAKRLNYLLSMLDNEEEHSDFHEEISDELGLPGDTAEVNDE